VPQPGTRPVGGKLQGEDGLQIGPAVELPGRQHGLAGRTGRRPPGVDLVLAPERKGLAAGREEFREVACQVVVVDHDQGPTRPQHPTDLDQTQIRE